MELLDLLYSIPGWVVILIVILTSLYIYGTWNFRYWEKQGIKSDKPWPFIGTLSDPFKTPMEEMDMELYKKYGRVYGAYEGRNPALMVADPEMLKTILVKDFSAFRNRRKLEFHDDDIMNSFLTVMKDDDWKDLRNIITPTFTTGKIKQMTSLMEECGEVLVNHFKKFAEKDHYFEAKQCLSSYTMDVIATCAFGTKIDALDDPESDFVKHAQNIFGKPSKLFLAVFLFPKLVKYIPNFMSKESTDYFKNLVENVLAARKKEKNARRDFLQLLIEAKAESEKENKDSANGNALEDEDKSKFVLTQSHILAQSMLFLFAGYETTATTITFVLYNLVLHEDIQEKVIKEVDEVLKKHNGRLTYDAISEMQYVDMVISETLRMYPPAVRPERECEVDNYNLHGIILKKGCVIGIPIYPLQHDEEYYPDPEKFDPERFSPENRNERNPYVYLPFGYGLRNCIGMRFALIEMKVALASIFKTFRVKKCKETEIPFKRSMRNVFLQPETMNIKVEIRTDN